MSNEAARPDGPTLPRCPHCGGDHPPHQLKCPDTDMPLPLEGRVLHGKFRFVRQLGKGGMAAVWAAVNTLVERRVAIKLIRPETGRNEETVARFRAEAKAAGRIGHPNVCEILDFGMGPLGPYIVMERLRGKSLGQLIRDEERLDPALAAGIVRQALAGLEAAHRRGIIHRDLKPENLFVHQPEAGPPVVKIMDFGVSKLLDGSSEVETEHGALLGTPEYMSPEQFKGASRADVRTDLWAMGAILYKALTGKTAFGGPSVAGTLLMVTTEEPTPISELVRGVPPELVAIVERCLRKDPDERFQSAQELYDELEPFDLETLSALVVVSGEPSSEEPTPATVSLRLDGPRADEESASSDHGREPDEDDAAQPETLLPTTRPRLTVEEPRKPTRPDRRAWLVIAGVTVIGASVLVALTRGPEPAPSEPMASAPARAELGAAETGEGSDGAPPSTTGAGSDDTEPGEAEPPTASTHGAEPPSTSTSGAEPPAASTTGEPIIDDEPTTGIPEGPDPDDGDDDGAGPAFDPATPPPTPPGTIRVGRYLTLAKPGPSTTHADARAYCKSLGKQSFVGVTGWTLAGPQTARKVASYVKKGKYWTTALWKGKALVIALPSKTTSSLAAEKKGPRPLCVAKWP